MTANPCCSSDFSAVVKNFPQFCFEFFLQGNRFQNFGIPFLGEKKRKQDFFGDSRDFDRDKESATAGFIRHLYENYPELRDSRFAKALYAYVKCILTISLDGRCSRQGFADICSALGKFSALQAARTRIGLHP